MSHVYVTRSEQRKAAANTDGEWALYEREPLSVFCAKPSGRSVSR
jgi:hypothetical protein